MRALDMLDALPSFSTMVVLPTGGGKTFTASNWLLRKAVNRHRKILWIAHRHMLLEQAAESFGKFAYADLVPDISQFSYRIVSGLPAHCSAASIRPDDDLVIASKDSLRSRLDKVAEWLRGETEVYVVVDEAHHATAKTYRNLINQIKDTVPSVKLIGLTATPFRTLEAEKGLLGRIFQDGIVGGRIARGETGIAYQIGLQDLINRQILSRPIMDTLETDEVFGESLGSKELESMQRLDRIPESVARQMVENAERNKLIVKTYAEKREAYGPTILFAINVAHAVALKQLFENAGVRSDFVVSTLKDDDSGRTRKQQENAAVIEAFRRGDLDVIINVNILTEGVDLPQTKSVFLTRPTSSTILMTQMIGRALRGVKSGGTAESHIVSFIDGWDERVAWVSPETLFSGDNQFNESDPKARERADIRAISVSKIKEFASILDETIDTSLLEGIPFIERIPLGMYVFSYTEQGDEDAGAEGSDVSCQVMVYSSTKDAYELFVNALEGMVSERGLGEEEFAPGHVLHAMVQQAEDLFFHSVMVPPYRARDLEAILKYYLQFGDVPPFYSFDAIDRGRLDVGAIARDVLERKMDRFTESRYVDGIWDEGDDNLLRLFFGHKRNFVHAVDTEIHKITNPELFPTLAAIAPQLASGDRGVGGTAAGRETTLTVSVPSEVPEVAPMAAAASAASTATVASLTLGVPAETNLDQERSRECDQGREGAAVCESASQDARSATSSFAQKREVFFYELGRLHPSEEALSSLEGYVPAGFAVHERTGKVIKKFGRKALIGSEGGSEVLYSHGYRVAERDAEGFVHLLEYEAEGEARGWRASRYALMHVQDFVAANLGLYKAPTENEIVSLASNGQSKLRIRNVAVRQEQATHRRAPRKQAASPAVASVLTDAKPQVEALSEPEFESAPKAAASRLEEPPSAVSRGAFNGFEPLYSDPERSSRKCRARVLTQRGADYLYVSPGLKVARWSKDGGLTLYEYAAAGVRSGWASQSNITFVVDFAEERLDCFRLSYEELRRMSKQPGSHVCIERPRDNGAGDGHSSKTSARPLKPASKPSNPQTHKVGDARGDRVARNAQVAESVAPSRKGDLSHTETAESFPPSKMLSVYDGNKVRTIAISSISYVKLMGRQGVEIRTEYGLRYRYQGMYEAVRRQLEKADPGSMVEVGKGFAVRASSVLGVWKSLKGSLCQIKVQGFDRMVYLPPRAMRELMKKRPDLKM